MLITPKPNSKMHIRVGPIHPLLRTVTDDQEGGDEFAILEFLDDVGDVFSVPSLRVIESCLEILCKSIFDNKSWTDLACLQAQMGAHRHTNDRPPQQFLLCMTLAHHLPKIFLLHTLRILDVSILLITNTNLKDIFAKE